MRTASGPASSSSSRSGIPTSCSTTCSSTTTSTACTRGSAAWSGRSSSSRKGSTYHDPKTGAELRSGTIADIHTTNPLIPGVVNGSFREFAVMPIDQVAGVDSTFNLRAEPLANRGTDPSLWFSSYKFGDPYTPLPKAYPGDPFVIRTISANPSVDTLHIDGMRFYKDPRYADCQRADQLAHQHLPPDGVGEVHRLARRRRRRPAEGAGRLPLLERRRTPPEGRRVGPDPRARRQRHQPAGTAGLSGSRHPGDDEGHDRRSSAGAGLAGQPVPRRRTVEGVQRQRRRRRLGHVQRRRPLGLRAVRPGRGDEAGHLQARAAGAARGRRATA